MTDAKRVHVIDSEVVSMSLWLIAFVASSFAAAGLDAPPTASRGGAVRPPRHGEPGRCDAPALTHVLFRRDAGIPAARRPHRARECLAWIGVAGQAGALHSRRARDSARARAHVRPRAESRDRSHA